MDAPSPIAPKPDPKRLISSLVLVVEYGILFLAAILILSIVCFRSTSRLRTRLVYFYVITIIISLLRVVAWSLEPTWIYTKSKGETFLHATLFSLPSMCLVSTYTILISYWADEYVSLHTPQRRVRNSTRKRILIGINIVLYIGEFIILSLNFWKSYDTYRLVQNHFLNVLYILSVAAFILYGFGLYRNWKHTPIARKSQSNIRRMRLTLFITITVAISFTIRVICNGIWVQFILNWSFRYPFEAIFYTTIEIIPICLILWLMLKSGFRFNPNRNQNAFKPLIAQVHYEGSQNYIINDEDLPESGREHDDYEDDDDDEGSAEETPGGIFD